MSGQRMRAREMSRRTLIWAAPGLVLGGIAAEGAGGPGRTPAAGVGKRVVPPQARGGSPAGARGFRSPSPLPVQSKPVRTLAEYRRVVPGAAYPANAVALTIDDGPHPVWTPQILRLLDSYQIPATFFMIGVEARGHAPVARSVVGAGHGVANHTWSHPLRLERMASNQIRQQINRAQATIETTTRQSPRLFRSPGGDWSVALMTQAAQAGLVPIDWSDDPRDWARPGTGPITAKLLAARPGQILLCHDGGGDRSQTYAALRTVIPALLARGYTFVSL